MNCKPGNGGKLLFSGFFLEFRVNSRGISKCQFLINNIWLNEIVIFVNKFFSFFIEFSKINAYNISEQKNLLDLSALLL